MGLVKIVIMKAGLWMLSLITSTLMALRLLYSRFREGPDFFYVKPRPSPPTLLYDTKWGKHAYMDIKSQGIKMHYVEAGDRSKPLMVFVHGFPECWFSWRHQLVHFAKTHWVVAMDLRGYGDSDKPTGTSQYKTSLLAEDLRLFIQALGREKCTLVAHDWGAALAWILVTFHPEMFSCYVSVNGPHRGFRKYMRQSLRQLLKSWYIFFFQMPWLPEIMWTCKDIGILQMLFKLNKEFDPSPDDVFEVYKYYFSQKDAFTFPINYYRNIDFEDTTEMPKVKVPTLVVWGTEDTALGQPIAILSGNDCERAKVKFIEGASHFVQQEQPQIVNKHIQDFLEQLPATN